MPGSSTVSFRSVMAQPTEEERLGVKHHFIGHLDIHEDMSAAAYAEAALPVLHELLERNGTRPWSPAVPGSTSMPCCSNWTRCRRPMPRCANACRPFTATTAWRPSRRNWTGWIPRPGPRRPAQPAPPGPRHRTGHAHGKPLSALRTGKRPGRASRCAGSPGPSP